MSLFSKDGVRATNVTNSEKTVNSGFAILSSNAIEFDKVINILKDHGYIVVESTKFDPYNYLCLMDKSIDSEV